jgi:hypothetical protein
MSRAIAESLYGLLRRRQQRVAADRKRVSSLAVVLILAMPFLLLPFAGAAVYFGAEWHFPLPPQAPAPGTQEREPQADAYRVAPIVFVPWTGKEICETRRFDNATGRISYDGTAPCDFPPPDEERSTGQQLRLSGEKTVTAADRMRGIQDAFRK